MKEDYKYVLVMFPYPSGSGFMPGTGITIQLWIVTVDILGIKERCSNHLDLTHSVLPAETMPKVG
jgi:hypothetical protein